MIKIIQNFIHPSTKEKPYVTKFGRRTLRTMDTKSIHESQEQHLID